MAGEPVSFAPGTIVGGYVLRARRGGGGFGSVWLAEDTETGERVALKLLTGQYAGSSASALRAEVELKAAAAATESPHVVRVLGSGTDPIPYIVMEFVDGTDLA